MKIRKHTFFALIILTIVMTGITASFLQFRSARTHTMIVEYFSGDLSGVPHDGLDSDGDGIPDIYDLCPGAIQGASGVDSTGCPTRFDPEAELVFQNEEHQKWYRRYWTGSCEGLRLPEICLPGAPNWHETVTQILLIIPEDRRGFMRNRLWALGQAVAFYWAKGDHDRLIETRDFQQWGNLVLNSDDIESTITQIEDEICSRMGSDFLNHTFAKGASCSV